jgi:hypothetical protein
MATITELQKKVVKALETGQDPAPILKELADVRASIAMEAEKEELQKIADTRQALRDKAETVKGKVRKQGEAVDAFLKARDNLVSQLQPFLEPARELARMGRATWEGNPGECYLYNDVRQFQASISDVPKELLPEDFKCPILEMTAPGERSFGKAGEALRYLEACIGILANLRKGFMTAWLKPTDEGLLLDNEPETTEPETETGSCIVCSSPEVETINNLLRQGKPLRDIEAGFAVSRSSLSRHKNHLGVMRVEPESPAASANKTFFHG